MAFLEDDVHFGSVSARGFAETCHAGVIFVAGTEAPVAACDKVDPKD